MYKFIPGDGNAYGNIIIYDYDGTYINSIENNYNWEFSAKPEYKYKVQVYSQSGTYSNAKLIPVNKSANAIYAKWNLAELEWVKSGGSDTVEILLSEDDVTFINNADQISEFVFIANAAYGVTSRVKPNNPNIFVLDSNRYLIAPYFSTGEDAKAYFTENNTVLEFNKRYR